MISAMRAASRRYSELLRDYPRCTKQIQQQEASTVQKFGYWAAINRAILEHIYVEIMLPGNVQCPLCSGKALPRPLERLA